MRRVKILPPTYAQLTDIKLQATVYTYIYILHTNLNATLAHGHLPTMG